MAAVNDRCLYQIFTQRIHSKSTQHIFHSLSSTIVASYYCLRNYIYRSKLVFNTNSLKYSMAMRTWKQMLNVPKGWHRSNEWKENLKKRRRRRRWEKNSNNLQPFASMMWIQRLSTESVFDLAQVLRLFSTVRCLYYSIILQNRNFFEFATM